VPFVISGRSARWSGNYRKSRANTPQRPNTLEREENVGELDPVRQLDGDHVARSDAEVLERRR
jgi:hypothetical protein